MSLPAKPQGFTAVVAGGGVALSWKANPAADAVLAYHVFRTPTAWFAPVPAATVAGPAAADASAELLPGTAWYYLLAAANASGFSPPVATAAVTIPKAAPPPILPVALALTASALATRAFALCAAPDFVGPPAAGGRKITAVRIGNYGSARVS
jgi:hypothetical protein